MKTTTVANPAAGADWTFTVPNSLAYQIEAIRAQLVTSATVATRVPVLRIADSLGNIVADITPTSTQAASLTQVYNWEAGEPSAVVSGTEEVIALPQGLVVEAGWTIQTVTTALQAADQWSQIVITDVGVMQTY